MLWSLATKNRALSPATSPVQVRRNISTDRTGLMGVYVRIAYTHLRYAITQHQASANIRYLPDYQFPSITDELALGLQVIICVSHDLGVETLIYTCQESLPDSGTITFIELAEEGCARSAWGTLSCAKHALRKASDDVFPNEEILGLPRETELQHVYRKFLAPIKLVALIATIYCDSESSFVKSVSRAFLVRKYLLQAGMYYPIPLDSFRSQERNSQKLVCIYIIE